RDHDVQRRRTRFGEAVPRLAGESLGGDAVGMEFLDRMRIDAPGRLAAGAERREAPRAQMIEGGLGQDAAGRIAGADEQDATRVHGWRFRVGFYISMIIELSNQRN